MVLRPWQSQVEPPPCPEGWATGRPAPGHAPRPDRALSLGGGAPDVPPCRLDNRSPRAAERRRLAGLLLRAAQARARALSARAAAGAPVRALRRRAGRPDGGHL